MYVYLHVCTINDWKRVATQILECIQESGLAKIMTELRVTVLGESQKFTDFMNSYNLPWTLVYHSPDLSLYERPCLESLREYAVTSPEPFYALYLHTKGIVNDSPQTRDWVKMLLWFNVTNFKNCLEALQSCSTCGINLHDLKGTGVKSFSQKSLHYSGNFWWAKSEYISKLPASIGPDYLEPELWIGNGPLHTSMGCLYNSDVPPGWGHYKKLYPPERYINTPIALKIRKIEK